MAELITFIYVFGSLFLFCYAIWLFFFPIMVIKRMNKIIQLLENDGDKREI